MRAPDVYVVTLRTSRGQLVTVPFAGVDQGQVLYTAMELYPDCQVVRVHREGEWGTADGAAVDHAAAW